MTKTEYRRSIGIVKGNVKNAVELMARIASDVNLPTSGVIDVKTMDQIIGGTEGVLKDFEQLLEIFHEIKTKLEEEN